MGHSTGEPGLNGGAPGRAGRWAAIQSRLGLNGNRPERCRGRSAVLGFSSALAMAGALTPPPLRAGDLTQDCHRWASASGNARIAVANQLGADHLLTKNTRLAESDPSKPVELYRFGDLQRLCRGT